MNKWKHMAITGKVYEGGTLSKTKTGTVEFWQNENEVKVTDIIFHDLAMRLKIKKWWEFWK